MQDSTDMGFCDIPRIVAPFSALGRGLEIGPNPDTKSVGQGTHFNLPQVRMAPRCALL
jgi:hypothetical protein